MKRKKPLGKGAKLLRGCRLRNLLKVLCFFNCYIKMFVLYLSVECKANNYFHNTK